MKAPALRGVCLRERRGDDSATYIIPLGGLVHSLILVISSTRGPGEDEPYPGPTLHHEHRRFAMRGRTIQEPMRLRCRRAFLGQVFGLAGSSAFPAVSAPVWHPIRVCDIVGMASRAMGFGGVQSGRGFSTNQVNPCRDRLQMVRVYAVPDAAKMVKRKARWYRPLQFFVRKAVRADRDTINRELPITAPLEKARSPQPAPFFGGFLINLSPESLRWSGPVPSVKSSSHAFILQRVGA